MNDKKVLTGYALTEKIRLKNRIVMAPMTRAKAKADGTPTQDMARYYAKRAGAGLIITEGTIISPDGRGYDNVPAIYEQQHVDQWRVVVDEVHAAGGKIFMQIWHVGRVSHPVFAATSAWWCLHGWRSLHRAR